jgi:hypothetical protein
MLYVAIKLVMAGSGQAFNPMLLGLAAASLLAFARGASPPLVLLSAGVIGILIFR